MNGKDIRRNPERWAALQRLVEAEVSLSEIRRTLGVDHRTVRRHFPDYKPFPAGGSVEACEIRETYRKLKEFERKGRIEADRDAGFNLRSRA